MCGGIDDLFGWVYLREIRSQSGLLSPVVQSSATIAFFNTLNFHVIIGGMAVLMDLSWLYTTSIVTSVLLGFVLFIYWYKIRSKHLLKKLTEAYNEKEKPLGALVYVIISTVAFGSFQFYSLNYFNWL
jgi:hypothetical protein